MDNYKIKLKDEASADEARDLFKELGYHPDNSSYEPYVGWVAVFEDGSGSFYSHNMNLNDCVEITIAQLRDLVVLKRNDINDANWETEGGDQIFKNSNDKSYIYRSDGWDELQRHEMRQAMWEKPKAIAKPQDPALISGAEAKLAWANGVDIQIKNVNCVNWYDLDESKYNLDIFDNVRVDFRLKPQTIKLELELPKPFEPKVGEWYFFVSTENDCGYSTDKFEGLDRDFIQTQFGAYRTANEVGQVVEQLRKIRGTNS